MKKDLCLTIISLLLILPFYRLCAALELTSEANIELGDIYSFERSTNHFHFVNTGDKVISGIHITATCPCIQPLKNSVTAIKPGEKYTISTYFKPETIDGSFKRGIWLTLESMPEQKTLLSVTGSVMPLFKGLPTREIVEYSSNTTEVFTNIFNFIANTTNYTLCSNLSTVNSNSEQKVILEKSSRVENTYKLTTIQKVEKGRIVRRSIKIPVKGTPEVKDIELKFRFRFDASLKATPSKIAIRDLSQPLSKSFFIRTSTADKMIDQLTYEPDIEGITLNKSIYIPRNRSSRQSNTGKSTYTHKRKTTYRCDLQISPDALKQLLTMKVPALTFRYPKHKSTIIRIIDLSSIKR